MDLVNETMGSSTWWDGVVYHSSRLWAQATQFFDDTTLGYISMTLFAIVMYAALVGRQFFLLGRPLERVTRHEDYIDQIRKKKKFLDRLAGNRESVSTVDGLDVLVNVRGDGREAEALMTPVIPKTGEGVPETVTVTIHFSKRLQSSGVEKLSGSLNKVCVAAAEDNMAASCWIRRATTVQGKVELRDSILNELKDVYKVAYDLDKDCTLQVESWAILVKEGDWQLTVFKEGGIPMIHHAEYAAGTLTICGKHLEGAEIKVANARNTVKLGKFQGQQMKTFRLRAPHAETCVEYSKLPVRLSTQEMDKVLVYAIKKREVEDQSVVIHSTMMDVKDALWNTVIERWIVANLLLIFIMVHLVWGLRSIFSSLESSFGSMSSCWILTICIILARLFHSTSSSNVLRNTAHGFVRAVWTIYFGAVDLIKGEPHLPASIGSGDSSPSFSHRLPTSAKPLPPMSGCSTSTRSFVNSILEQQKAENKNDLSEAWEPCIVEKFSESSGRTVLRKVEKREDAFDTEKNPFAVVYRREERLPWSDEVIVQLASEHLIKILQRHIPFHGNLFCTERPEIPGRDIFVVVDSLNVEGAGIKQDQLTKAQLHLDLLVRYIREEYKDVFLRLRRLKQERLVTHDMLWAFFIPGQKVVYKCQYTQTLLCATIAERIQYRQGSKRLTVMLDVFDFNGRMYRSCNISREILNFDGERLFESLPVCPISLTSRPQEVLEAEFVASGRRFYELAVQQSYRFMNYQGSIFSPQKKSKLDPLARVEENADGRVMIDTERFFSMNPGFKMMGLEPSIRRASYDDEYVSQAVPEDVSDEKLMITPGVVFGFSFPLKQWGLFDLSGFSEVVYDTSAFNELVVEPEDKSLIYSLVSQYVAGPQRQLDGIDPISKKGEGCIVLCYGAPGTGKTLTAESVAESLQRPLWALSLSQLSTAPEELERALSRVLYIASLWQAVLLLDEADIFLEKRTNNMDLGRNAMIGVLLRQLEYYRGIMFLTTNRVSAFDDAVRSRVSMLVCYRQLNATQRGQVWKIHLARAGIHDVSVLEELGALDFNGREIRNVVHTAQVWAKSKNKPLQMEHVKYVVKMFSRSIRTLEDAVDQ